MTEAVQALGAPAQDGAPMAPSEPLAGPSTMAKVRPSPSASPPARVIVVAVSSFVETLWAAAVGASLTAVTVIAKVCAALSSSPPPAVPPSSARETVTVAVPLAFAAGV